MNKKGLNKAQIIIACLLLLSMFVTNGCSKTAEKAVSGDSPEVVKRDGWTEVGKDIFIFTSGFYLANMALVTSGSEAVLVDTGMDEKDKQGILDFLSEKNIKLKGIIITHMHSDHAANLNALKTDEMIVITPENFTGGQVVKLGNKTLRIIPTEGHYKPKGHISVELVEDKILIAGDVICNNIIPPIAAGGDIEALLGTLEGLQKKDYSLIIPGHGEIIENKLLFERQLEYLNNAKKAVEKVISSGGRLKDLDNVKLEDCIKDTSYLYKERLEYWHKQSLQVIYLQLKKSS